MSLTLWHSLHTRNNQPSTTLGGLPLFSNVFAIVIFSFADLQVVDPCDVLALAPSRRRAIAAGNQTTCGPTTCLWA